MYYFTILLSTIVYAQQIFGGSFSFALYLYFIPLNVEKSTRVAEAYAFSQTV